MIYIYKHIYIKYVSEASIINNYNKILRSLIGVGNELKCSSLDVFKSLGVIHFPLSISCSPKLPEVGLRVFLVLILLIKLVIKHVFEVAYA